MNVRNILVFVLIGHFCAAVAIAGWFGPDVEPVDLRCEYLVDPSGIDTVKPRLSWKIVDSRMANEDLKPGKATFGAQKTGIPRSVRQKSYQVLVASSRGLLKEGKADLWDSGKVESDQSTQVEYRGKILQSRMQCFWMVKVFTTAGEAWSRPACWTMGLLKSEDWTGKWITMTVSNGLAHPWFRRTFEVKAEVKDAKVYVNTPSHYELYINGKKAGTDVLAPAHVNLKKRFLYNVIDVTGMLRRGTNCMALWTGPGWYQPRYGNPHHAPIVRVQLMMDGDDGEVVIGSDDTWRVADSCISQIGPWGWNEMGGERWDAGRYVEGWAQASFDDSRWAAAVPVPAPSAEVSWQAMPGSKVRPPITPKRIFPVGNKWVVDFGTTLTGWMRLRMTNLKPGQKIVIDYADLNVRKLEFQPNADGYQTYNQRDVFVAGDRLQDGFCSKFNQHAFRYAVIEGLSQAPEMADAVAMTVETDLEKAGDFECSNELFNRIHQITVNTYHSQIPCGALGGGEPREKLGYGDGGTFLSGMLYNLRSDAFFQKWLRDWCDGQRDDGFPGNTAPEYYPAGGGPSWGAQASELTWRLYQYYGDRRGMTEHYGALRKYVDYLETHTQGDILKKYNPYPKGADAMWQFLGDWVAPGKNGDFHTFVFETPDEREFFNNCWRVRLWEQLAGYAEALGDSVEAQRCRQRLEVLKPLIHATFFDPGKKAYRVNRQGYLVMALCSGIVPSDLRASLLKQLEENIVVLNKGHLDTGMQTSFLLLDLLAKEGRNDLVDLIMNQTTFPGWGFLVKERQVTSWPETWSGWGSQAILVTASPGAWFYEGLAGIRPDPAHPGFKRFVVRPGLVESVTWVKCHYDSIHGRIESDWKRDGTRLTMNVMIPPNTSATVFVPAKDGAVVTEGGKTIDKVSGVKFLRLESGAAVYEVGSGQYSFSSER